jgi:hypothetical protein
LSSEGFDLRHDEMIQIFAGGHNTRYEHPGSVSSGKVDSQTDRMMSGRVDLYSKTKELLSPALGAGLWEEGGLPGGVDWWPLCNKKERRFADVWDWLGQLGAD